jgi:HSP20 family molecular chaperone IbpA
MNERDGQRFVLDMAIPGVDPKDIDMEVTAVDLVVKEAPLDKTPRRRRDPKSLPHLFAIVKPQGFL